MIRGFNEYLQWVDGRPVLAFSRPDLRRIRFYARLQTALAHREAQWFGQIPEEVSGTQRDKRQLGAYYLVDWILRRGTVPFARAERHPGVGPAQHQDRPRRGGRAPGHR